MVRILSHGPCNFVHFVSYSPCISSLTWCIMTYSLEKHFLTSQNSSMTFTWDYDFSFTDSYMCLLSSVQLLSHVQLFATPWIAACQTSLSITNSQSLLKLMSIELVMPSSHLILCRPLLLLPQSLPASGSFPMSQLFSWGGQSFGVSASASVLPVNSQDWSPLGWTGWISVCLLINYKCHHSLQL